MEKLESEVYIMLFDKYDAEAARRVRDKEVAEEATARERRKTLDALKKSLPYFKDFKLIVRCFNLTPEEQAYVTSDET